MIVHVVGQGRRSKFKVKCQKLCLASLLACFKIKVGVKVKDHCQGQMSNFWRTLADIRDSALPSAAKSKEES